MSATEAVEAAQAFFERVIRRDAEALSQVATGEGMTVSGGHLCFTLKGLHHSLGLARLCDYPQFRSALYQSRLNEQLAALGYRVEVAENTGKVDQSLYRLAPIPLP